MAGKSKTPTFVARATYRQRRLRDAARLLPVLGAVLMMVPLAWPRGEGAGGTATAVQYFFGLWFILIVISALLTRQIDLSDEEPLAPHAAIEPTEPDVKDAN